MSTIECMDGQNDYLGHFPAHSGSDSREHRDPLVFDFLGVSWDAAEHGVEPLGTGNIVETLRGLGPGFTFAGRQVRRDLESDDVYVDFLFFHAEQLRYIAVQLRAAEFRADFVDELGLHVAMVDDFFRLEQHAPTVGILVCGNRDHRTVRYVLGAPDSTSTTGYAFDALPADERLELPLPEDVVTALRWVPGV